MIFVARFALFNFFPALLFFMDLILWTVSLEMSMLMTKPALERELLVIQLLVMMSVSDFQLNCFR